MHSTMSLLMKEAHEDVERLNFDAFSRWKGERRNVGLTVRGQIATEVETLPWRIRYSKWWLAASSLTSGGCETRQEAGQLSWKMEAMYE